MYDPQTTLTTPIVELEQYAFTKYFDIFINDLPVPIIQPLPYIQIISEGHTVSLTCLVSNSTLNEVIAWDHDGVIVSRADLLLMRNHSYALNVVEYDGSTHLWVVTIGNVNVTRDAGTWTCVLAPELSLQKESIQLDGLTTNTMQSLTNSVVIPNLNPATSYNFWATSSSINGQRYVGSASGSTDLQTEVNVDSVSTTSVTLSWTPIPGSFFYRVFYTGPDWLERSGNPTTDPTTTVTGLTPGTMYTFRVESTDQAGQRVLGNVAASTDLQTEVNVDSVSTTSATLSWTPIPGSFFYRVFYTGPDGVEQSGNPTTDPTTTITGLTPGTMYTFRVESTDGAGQRVLGNVPATTEILQTEVRVDSITETTAVISWTSVPGSVIYQIFYTGPDGVERAVSSTNPTITLTGLTPASQYDIRVQSTSGTGQQLEVGTTTTTTDLQTEVNVDSVSTTSVTLSWTPIPGNFFYRVFYTGPDGVEQSGNPTTDPTTTVTGLTPGTMYTFRVESTDQAGQRVLGNVATSTDVQTEVNVDTVSTTSATLSWTPIPGSFFYRVFYTGPDGVEQSGNPTTDPTAIITGLTPGTMYTFRVESTDQAGQVVLGNVTSTTGVLVNCSSDQEKELAESIL
eukprot:XP_011669875.1 PREDICTED: receptor-type tyrosine-protein phosphatase eta-like [Strongylocentrotus purpuratus]